MAGIVNSSNTTVMVVVSGEVYPLPPGGSMGGDEDSPTDVDGFWVDGVFYYVEDVAVGTTVAHVFSDQNVTNATTGVDPQSVGWYTSGPPLESAQDTKPLTKINSSYVPESAYHNDPDSVGAS